MARNTQGRGRPQRAAGHAHPREVRRDASVARLERRGRARGAPHVPQLGRLRGRRGAARDASRRRSAAVQDAAARAAVDGAGPRASRVDMASAALLNGISSHTFDFDDTHLKTIIHPAGPVASALLALAEVTGASGRAGDRRAGARHRRRVPRRQHDVSRALRPRLAHHRLHRHARRGGRVRAPAAASTSEQTAMALGIAASQPVGMREQFGTDDQAVPSRAPRRARASCRR